MSVVLVVSEELSWTLTVTVTKPADSALILLRKRVAMLDSVSPRVTEDRLLGRGCPFTAHSTPRSVRGWPWNSISSVKLSPF